MKTIGIIAEFNPFHNGHKYIIEKSRQETGADYCVVVMSGDFVQRGAPAIVDKFARAKMALSCGADLVLELPIYYSLGSAEFFASGAVSILDSLGVIDHLCFGSESGDLASLTSIARVLCDEPEAFKSTLAKELKDGKSFPAARAAALSTVLDFSPEILDSPNNILAIEYLKALYKRDSHIQPCTILRKGESFHSRELNEFSSATAIRNALGNENSSVSAVNLAMPTDAFSFLKEYSGKYLDSDAFSQLLSYKLIQESDEVFEKYLDISGDFSNKIANEYRINDSFSVLCDRLKSKDLSYSRISRSLFHILLNITGSNMTEYQSDNYTSYARILGFRKESSKLLSDIHEMATIPVLDRLKDASTLLSPLQLRLFKETLNASRVYNILSQTGTESEFSLKNIIL